ncbi:MAG: hypothetical protein Q7W05_02300 [Deltaproteobacteria bacterium]|nr:hypothetical protein [Deltaproteobacteria bacterium]
MTKNIKQTHSDFCLLLNKGHTEEDIKNVYAKHFGISYDTSDRHDLYTPQVLFEFKYDKNLENLKARATILAQTLYYVRRLKYGHTDKMIPPVICIVDKNEAIITETLTWKVYTTDSDERYDWDLAASIPDARLIDDLMKAKELKTAHVYKIQNDKDYDLFAEKISGYFVDQLSLPLGDKKLITEDNFEAVYEYWNQNFGEDVRNGLKASRYFISDIQKDRTHIDKRENKIVFVFESGERKIKKILLHRYEYFWSIYEKVTDKDLIRSIYAKLDRLTDEELRRFQGEFFTPVKFAKKGLDYLEKTLGKEWWKENYRIWDMAAGTGNLQYHLPSEAYKHTYLSTIHHEDVEHCKRLFPGATVFKYDYLNDDIENLFTDGEYFFDLTWELPEQLRNDLKNPKIKWVVMINPPFATSQTAGTRGKKSKKDVSDTKIRKVMHGLDLGVVSRELFAQFLFRIKKEFGGKNEHLGLFSTLKYINSNNDQKFRDKAFQFRYERGFVFSSANFSGTKTNNSFPIGFLVWDLSKRKKIEEQNIILDVFDVNVDKIGVKHYISEHRSKFLNKWIERAEANIVYPPFGSAINVKAQNKDIRDRVAEGFLASLMCKGNDFQNQNYTALLSGPYASAGALSIIPDNFEKGMVIHAVRRIPKADWLNDRDQYLQPNKKLKQDFINDCMVWNLFCSSNQTVAMKDVVYDGNTYQIPNNLFPFNVNEVKKWTIADKEIKATLHDAENRFMAAWLHKANLSPEAEEVISAGKAVYKYYFEHINELSTGEFKIQTWDAGWWQIRSALNEQNMCKDLLDKLKEAHNRLKEKILPQIYEYGFLT